LAKYAGNREELYEKLSRKLDLPILGPAISLDYLKSLLKLNSPYFRIYRSQTRPLGMMKYRKRFDAKKTLILLETTLAQRKYKPTGFNQWSPPGNFEFNF